MYNFDITLFRLFVKSQSLEIVYNPGAVRWLIDFLSYPLSINNKSKVSAPETISNQIGAYVHVKNTTKMHLINQWEHILQGNLVIYSIKSFLYFYVF